MPLGHTPGRQAGAAGVTRRLQPQARRPAISGPPSPAEPLRNALPGGVPRRRRCRHDVTSRRRPRDATRVVASRHRLAGGVPGAVGIPCVLPGTPYPHAHPPYLHHLPCWPPSRRRPHRAGPAHARCRRRPRRLRHPNQPGEMPLELRPWLCRRHLRAGQMDLSPRPPRSVSGL